MRLIFAASLMAGLIACSSGGNNPPDGGSPDSGTPVRDGGAGNIWTLDSSAMNPDDYIAMAISSDNRVGVTYYRNINSNDSEIRYVEWQNGAVSSIERLPPTVQQKVGLSITFQPNGQPAVAYLGGSDDGTMSPFWHQSDAAVSFRQSNGTWVEDIAARVSTDGPTLCNNTVSDAALNFVLGLWPAIKFIGSTAYIAYRDVHQGQFPQQDWQGSDLRLAWGTPGNWSRRPVVCGGDDKKAYGGHIQMVVGAQGRLALASDEIFDSSDGPGTNVLFHQQNMDGSWSGTPWFSPLLTVSNTQKGPSLAYDSTLGYAIAVVERSQNILLYKESTDGSNWTQQDQVFGQGTGGWYPSVAIDPMFHEPTIVFYICSNQSGVPEGSCPAAQRQLKAAHRVLGQWTLSTIDPLGGVLPKFGFLSNGKRAVAYRDPGTGAVLLFVDK
jgi:hypothetical protein